MGLDLEPREVKVEERLSQGEYLADIFDPRKMVSAKHVEDFPGEPLIWTGRPVVPRLGMIEAAVFSSPGFKDGLREWQNQVKATLLWFKSAGGGTDRLLAAIAGKARSSGDVAGAMISVSEIVMTAMTKANSTARCRKFLKDAVPMLVKRASLGADIYQGTQEYLDMFEYRGRLLGLAHEYGVTRVGKMSLDEVAVLHRTAVGSVNRLEEDPFLRNSPFADRITRIGVAAIKRGRDIDGSGDARGDKYLAVDNGRGSVWRVSFYGAVDYLRHLEGSVPFVSFPNISITESKRGPGRLSRSSLHFDLSGMVTIRITGNRGEASAVFEGDARSDGAFKHLGTKIYPEKEAGVWSGVTRAKLQDLSAGTLAWMDGLLQKAERDVLNQGLYLEGAKK